MQIKSVTDNVKRFLHLMNSIYLQVAGSQPLSKLMIYHTEITVEAIVAMVGLEPGTHYFFDTFLGSKWV